MKTDIWTIVFDNDEEIFLLKKQIESLIQIKNTLPYNIIINEFNPSNTRKKLKKSRILSLLKTAKFETNVYNMCDIVESKYLHQSQGYVNQQILKLHVHIKSKCNDHIILDAKNIITSRYIIDNFHPKRHQIPSGFLGCYEFFNQRWHNGKIIPVRPFTTPYQFKKNILLALQKSFNSDIKYVKALTAQYIPTSKPIQRLNKTVNRKLKVLCISEFYIYNLFEQRYDRNYTEYSGPSAKIAWIYSMDDVPSEIQDYDVCTIHRKTVEKIGTVTAEKIINKFIYGAPGEI
tara:strand:+ start:497 stop:1363 length:867 start_codon:yes stop_codon:yes gene_type:complete